MIYAVGPNAEGDGVSSMTPSFRLLRFALAAAAMFAVGLSGCVVVVWLVLQPVGLSGAVGEPFPSHVVGEFGVAVQQPAEMPDLTALIAQPAQRLRCAHNAASVR